MATPLHHTRADHDTDRCRSPRLLDHRRLVAATIAGAVLETAAVSAFGMAATTGLAPQVTAPAPFGVFHDLRWLLVFHSSWWSFGLEAALVVVARSAATAGLVAAAWPRDVALPPRSRLVRSSVEFVLVTAVLLLPSAGLLFGVAVVSLSWLFFVAVPTALVVAVLVHHVVVGDHGWRTPPTLRTTAWVLVTFVVLSLGGAAVTVSPSWPARLVAAALIGLFNAWAWLGIVHAVACRHHAPPLPLAPIGIAVLAGVLVGGSAIGFATVTGSSRLRRAVRDSTPGTGQPVLLVTGFASTWDGTHRDRLPGSFAEQRFSYRGLDGGSRPLPYRRRDTDRALRTLVETMRQQVDAIARRRHARVAIVAESEGALVAAAYLAATPGAPVSDLVLLSPLVEPARVYYPPPGRQGWGMVAGDVLAATAAGVRWVSPLELSANGPLLRSIVRDASLRHLLGCDVPGVREVALFPLADAVAAPHPDSLAMTVGVVPSFHGGLLGNVAARREIALALEHRPLRTSRVLRVIEGAVRFAASAWQVPELPPSLNGAWAGGVDRCPTARRRRAGAAAARPHAPGTAPVRWRAAGSGCTACEPGPGSGHRRAGRLRSAPVPRSPAACCRPS